MLAFLVVLGISYKAHLFYFYVSVEYAVSSLSDLTSAYFMKKCNAFCSLLHKILMFLFSYLKILYNSLCVYASSIFALELIFLQHIIMHSTIHKSTYTTEHHILQQKRWKLAYRSGMAK